MTKRPTWCVWAMIRDDGLGITAAIYPAATLTDEAWKAHLKGEPLNSDNPEERTSRSGDDWRSLLIEAVTETARRTGGKICNGGSFACKRNGKLDKAIVAEANQILHELWNAQIADAMADWLKDCDQGIADYRLAVIAGEARGLSPENILCAYLDDHDAVLAVIPDTPTAFTAIKLPGGELPARAVGIYPRPRPRRSGQPVAKVRERLASALKRPEKLKKPVR